ncbi:MAG: exodeoxyribonuclease V subunit gamma [Succinivibrionaceae bacterium]|nr:exodeoxyribonuclease V subunit gamma [Succinivibrionaceae bacterium]
MSGNNSATGGDNKGVFHVFHSNSLEDLASLTAKLMEVNPPTDPFTPFEIIVPNAGMKNWLDIRIAQKRGISMLNRYSRPWSFAWQLLEQLGLVEASRPQERYRMDSMVWTIYTVLKEILEDRNNQQDNNLQAVFASISSYVRPAGREKENTGSGAAGTTKPDGDDKYFDWENCPWLSQDQAQRADTRLYQLSQAIAEIFDRYIIYRSRWLSAASASQVDYVKNFSCYSKSVSEDSSAVGDDASGSVSQALGKSLSAALEKLWAGVTPEDFKSLSRRQKLLIYHNIWQVALWKKVVEKNSPKSDDGNGVMLASGDRVREGHIAEMIDIFCRKLETDDSGIVSRLPKCLFVFGISSLEPLFIRMLKAMSRHVMVFYMYFNPCRSYWCDLVKQGPNIDSVLDRLKSHERRVVNTDNEEQGSVKVGYSVAELPETDSPSQEGESAQPVSATHNISEHCRRNRLLSSWGRQGSDNLFQLIECMDTDSEVFEDPFESEKAADAGAGDGKSKRGVLQLLQSRIFNDVEIDPFSAEALGQKQSDFIWENLEHNLEIHSCYSPLREVEAVYDRILRLFQTDPTLKPNDLVVMAPSISKYAPFIHGVFGRRNDLPELNIPYVISDQTYAQESTFLKSIYDLLFLPWRNIGASFVLSLLDVGQIQTRFGLSAADVARIGSWVQKATVRGDYDESGVYTSENSEDIEIMPIYSTWLRAIQRMAAGSVMPEGAHSWFGRILPTSVAQGQSMQTLASLSSLVRMLFELRKKLDEIIAEGGLTASGWLDFMQRDVVEAFFQEDDEIRSEILSLYEIITDLAAKFDNIDRKRLISLEVFTDCIKSAAGRKESFRPFMSGNVNFCTFVPMRSIPFRHIFMLGMNSVDFPRQDTAYDFDLMRRGNGMFASRGDRSSRNDDRYMFLETIMSASCGLYIYYVGRSNVNNAELNPSVLVTELLGFLSENIALEKYFTEFKQAREDFGANNSMEARISLAARVQKLIRDNVRELQKPVPLQDLATAEDASSRARLVFQDTLNLWDGENFVSGSTFQSYQRDWCPVAGDSRESREREFFLHWLRTFMASLELYPDVWVKCHDATARTRDKPKRLVLEQIVKGTLASGFSFRAQDGNSFALPDVDELLDLILSENNQDFNVFVESIWKIPGNGPSDRQQHFQRRQIMLDDMPKIILSALERENFSVSFDGYNARCSIGTLVTDAGSFRPDSDKYWECDKDGNRSLRTSLQEDMRTLTLKLSDLTEFMNDPLDRLYRVRFELPKDTDERFQSGIEDSEPLEQQKVEDFCQKDEIRNYCIRLGRELDDCDWGITDEEIKTQATPARTVSDVYNELTRKGKAIDMYLNDLKFSGAVPTGHAAVRDNESFAASDLLMTDCKDQFLMGIMRNRLIRMKQYQRADAIRVHVEFELDRLPEPYSLVFNQASGRKFKIVIEDTISDIYSDASGRFYHLYFRDINNEKKDHRKFLLEWFLLSLNSISSDRPVCCYYTIDSKIATEAMELYRCEPNPALAQVYLQELLISYLRGMAEPLVHITDHYKFHTDKDSDKTVVSKLAKTYRGSKIPDIVTFTADDSLTFAGIFAGRVPCIPSRYLAEDESGFGPALKALFHDSAAGCKDAERYVTSAGEIVDEDGNVLFAPDTETGKTVARLADVINKTSIFSSDFCKTDNENSHFGDETKFTVRQRLLFQKQSAIPLKRTVALAFLMQHWPAMLLARNATAKE